MEATTTQLVAVTALVVGVAIGAVLLLVPSARTATFGGSRAGPIVPAAEVKAGRAAWVLAENKKPGTSDWHITGPVSHGDIEGFADATSINVGQSVRLFVSTKGGGYRVEAYRIGWYGGRQARLVWRSDPLRGSRQREATVDPTTNMAEARWSPSLTVKTDRSWPPGNYLFKLVADNGYAQYVPLTVRDDPSKASLLVINAVTTWQAYNQYGGYSLYKGPDGRRGSRARAVSFDRPYEAHFLGAGQFLQFELPAVRVAERAGVPLGYATDIDLHADPHLLDGARAMLTLGHDEYWSTAMRQAATAARDRAAQAARELREAEDRIPADH